MQRPLQEASFKAKAMRHVNWKTCIESGLSVSHRYVSDLCARLEGRWRHCLLLPGNESQDAVVTYAPATPFPMF